jgi:glycosyltransferase involved in cell wall biosynthesis
MKSLAIAQIASADDGGGAALVARGLREGYAARGHRVWHLVGRTRGDDPAVRLLPDDDRLPYRISGYTAMQSGLRRLAGRFPNRGFGLISRSLRMAAHPRAFLAKRRGLEDFDFPATARCIERLDGRPDVVHGHNLQGGYFDLRALVAISAAVPTMITLHDMWLLTGHCAQSLDCTRWQTGCGDCPDLHLDPPIERDATRENWQRKHDVVAKSSLHLVTPSQWLADRVFSSQLAPLIKTLRVIPNGVDTALFRSGMRAAARDALALPQDRFIVMLTTGSHGSMWKDDRMLKDAVRRLAAGGFGDRVEFIAVGRETAVVPGSATRSVPFQHDRREMAKYFQAADIYLHAAHADTSPLSVLESMACGTPVVASRVGGIPEQLADDAGVLVDPHNGAQMAGAVERLLGDDALRVAIGERAAARAHRCFTLDRQVDAYLALYRELGHA